MAVIVVSLRGKQSKKFYGIKTRKLIVWKKNKMEAQKWWGRLIKQKALLIMATIAA